MILKESIEGGFKMFLQGLIIAGLGMGGVFFFLFLLVCFMNLLQSLRESETNRDKIAAAIAFALHNNYKK